MNSKPIHILLIEDSRGEARLIQEFLSDVKEFSCSTEVADRLSTGLSRLAEGKTDVVLLDLSLPDSHGLETLDAVRAKAPDVPVVVLTGAFAEDALSLEAVQRGAQDYLVKGLPDGPSLARALRYAIERHRVRGDLGKG